MGKTMAAMADDKCNRVSNAKWVKATCGSGTVDMQINTVNTCADTDTDTQGKYVALGTDCLQAVKADGTTVVAGKFAKAKSTGASAISAVCPVAAAASSSAVASLIMFFVVLAMSL